MKQEYLNEEKYNKIKKILKTIGLISLCIGILLFITSFMIKVPKMRQEGWYQAQNKKNIMCFLSFTFGIMIPIPTLFIAYNREIKAFAIQQSMPIAEETIEKMAPTAGVVAKEITKGVKEGLKEKQDNEKK